MCVKEFIGFYCGHCALPTLIACPLASQSPHFPYCRYPAERAMPVAENCPPCARVVWNQRTLASEEVHREMHVRLGRGQCTFEGGRGWCEIRFDVDIEREWEREGWNREVGEEKRGERVAVTIGEGGRGQMGRRKLPKMRKSREIDETIARVEARFAAVSAGMGRRATIEEEDGSELQANSQREEAAPDFERSSLNMRDEKMIRDSVRSEEDGNEQFSYQLDRHLTTGTGYGAGPSRGFPSRPELPNPPSMYIGYQLYGELVRDGASPVNASLGDAKETRGSGDQTGATSSPDVSGDFEQKNIGSAKYYPGEEQYERAGWEEMVANAKHNKAARSAVPTGPRFDRDRSIQFGNMTPRMMRQDLPYRWRVPPNMSPGTNASTDIDVHSGHDNLPSRQTGRSLAPFSCSQLAPAGAMESVVPQSEFLVPLTVGHMAASEIIPPAQSGNPIQESGHVLHSHTNHQYQYPVIVSSDMANPDPSSIRK